MKFWKLLGMAFLTAFLVHQAASEVRPSVELDYRYSTIITSNSSQANLQLLVENRHSTQRTFEIKTNGVNALVRGKNSIKITMSPDENRRIPVRISPDSPGTTFLEVTVNDTELGTAVSERIPVYVRGNTAAGLTREVPGSGFLQLMVLFLAATVLYSASL